jgi:hypothetical protein
MIPFAVVGSERNVIIDGKPVRGRKNRWGVVNVEDERHCEFVYLRDFLLRFVPFRPLIWHSLSTASGLTCKTSLRRPPKFTTRPSARSSSWHSRKPPPAPAPLLLHKCRVHACPLRRRRPFYINPVSVCRCRRSMIPLTALLLYISSSMFGSLCSVR